MISCDQNLQNAMLANTILKAVAGKFTADVSVAVANVFFLSDAEYTVRDRPRPLL